MKELVERMRKRIKVCKLGRKDEKKDRGMENLQERMSKRKKI